MCADLVQKITVMGYYDNRIVKIDQELLQPFDSRKIQVVGRLIKKKDIRISEKSLCKKNLDLHTTGKVCHLCIVELGVDSETVEKSSSIGLCFPSVHFCKLTLKLAGTDAIFVCEIFLCVNGFFLFHDLIESFITHDDSIQNRISIIFEVILLQERKSLTGGDHNVALGRLELTGKDFEECRFSCAVGADQSITVTLCKFDVNVFKQRFFSNAQCDVIC